MRRCLRRVNAALTIITDVQQKKNVGRCGEKFPKKEVLLIHVQKEHNDTKCPVCFGLLLSKAQLTEHMTKNITTVNSYIMQNVL